MGFVKYQFDGYQGRNIQLQGPLRPYIRSGNVKKVPGQGSSPVDGVGAAYLWEGMGGLTSFTTSTGVFFPPLPINPNDWSGFINRYSSPTNPGILILADGYSGITSVENWLGSNGLTITQVVPDPYDYNASQL